MFIKQTRPDTYLLLESEGDAAHWALLNALHQVGGVTGDLVSKSLGLDNCNVVDDSLVHMEVLGQPTLRLTRKKTYFP